MLGFVGVYTMDSSKCSRNRSMSGCLKGTSGESRQLGRRFPRMWKRWRNEKLALVLQHPDCGGALLVALGRALGAPGQPIKLSVAVLLQAFVWFLLEIDLPMAPGKWQKPYDREVPYDRVEICSCKHGAQRTAAQLLVLWVDDSAAPPLGTIGICFSKKKSSVTLPETKSSPLKTGLPKRKAVSQAPFFRGKLAVSFREGWHQAWALSKKTWHLAWLENPPYRNGQKNVWVYIYLLMGVEPKIEKHLKMDGL